MSQAGKLVKILGYIFLTAIFTVAVPLWLLVLSKYLGTCQNVSLSFVLWLVDDSSFVLMCSQKRIVGRYSHIQMVSGEDHVVKHYPCLLESRIKIY